MRLIDADDVLRKMESTMDMQDLYLPIHFKEVIDEVPTVDAVEVVRCKDCKLFVSDMEWCEADDEHRAEPDAFCSWAERRDG